MPLYPAPGGAFLLVVEDDRCGPPACRHGLRAGGGADRCAPPAGRHGLRSGGGAVDAARAGCVPGDGLPVPSSRMIDAARAGRAVVVAFRRAIEDGRCRPPAGRYGLRSGAGAVDAARAMSRRGDGLPVPSSRMIDAARQPVATG